jgi:site-specific DNA-cytosine methylase
MKFKIVGFKVGVSRPTANRTYSETGIDWETIAALGNAVVPQVAEWLGRRIIQTMNGGCA